MKVLITGVAGFAGSHLADLALAEAAEVVGLCLPGTSWIRAPHLPDQITVIDGDLRAADEVKEIVCATRPDVIYHLAAFTFVPQAARYEQEVIDINVIGTLNLFAAARECRPLPLIINVSSNGIYGEVPPALIPINESVPLQPISVYGVSKAAQDLLAFQYFKAHDLPIIRARPFNHIGPRQRPEFAISDFARQIARIAAGQQPPTVSVGNLAVSRDLLDVRDVVHAYWLLAQSGTPGEAYNIASGEAHSLQAVVELMGRIAGVTINIEQDATRVRSNDLPVIVGDSTKLRRTTGWQPAFDLPQTLADILADWRQRATWDG
jgi:GDP-4-dehydro-6-deoxy-D-mannose reductase